MANLVRFTAIAAAAGALVLAMPLQARDVGSWQIQRSKQGACMMTATFDDDTYSGIQLSLVWTKEDGRLGFLAASQQWNDLRDQEGDPTTLRLNFNGNVPYTTWLRENARFQNIGSGTEAIMGYWSPDYSEDLAKAVTSSSQVELSIGGSDLGAFDISGAGEAYQALLRCGERGRP